jgi:hypothetical protein
MRRRLDKMQKLVRFREFQESLVANAMRQRIAETREAHEAHDVALGEVDVASGWKARALNDGHLDVGFYGAALGNEQHAVDRCEAARSSAEESQQRTDDATDLWCTASSATRVSRERERAEERRIAGIEEKRDFDQLADLLLSKKAGKHD